MRRKKVLYVLHNHPSIRPGGSESYALELYQAMQQTEQFEPILLARIGPDVSMQRSSHPGAPLSTVNADPNQYFFFTEEAHYDFFFSKLREKSLYTNHFANFLRAQEPDIVHFQHTFFIGIDLVSLTRRVLPDTPIVYTLHEYLPICHRQGQLLRTNGELCLEASPRRCHECFPEISPQYFFLRERFGKSHLAHVDLFLAPSHFLLERYVDWGIPREKIRLEDYGRRPEPRLPEQEEERPRTRLAFFGQANPYKGLQVLLRAMGILHADRPDIHAWVHAANLELQHETWKADFNRLLEAAEDAVTFTGAYDRAILPRLMADTDWVVVPSMWWENSPLVIQEAFIHGRPVICSNVGGMAEKVTDGVNGLHFQVGNPGILAETIRRAVDTPGLWEQLRSGIPEVFSIDEHIANLTNVYTGLLRQARQARQAALIG
jgi:glycosyltransferase involved in cell wall biosynthesis